MMKRWADHHAISARVTVKVLQHIMVVKGMECRNGNIKGLKQLIIALIDISIIKLSYMVIISPLLDYTLESPYDNYLLNMACRNRNHSTSLSANLYNSL